MMDHSTHFVTRNGHLYEIHSLGQLEPGGEFWFKAEIVEPRQNVRRKIAFPKSKLLAAIADGSVTLVEKPKPDPYADIPDQDRA